MWDLRIRAHMQTCGLRSQHIIARRASRRFVSKRIRFGACARVSCLSVRLLCLRIRISALVAQTACCSPPARRFAARAVTESASSSCNDRRRRGRRQRSRSRSTSRPLAAACGRRQHSRSRTTGRRRRTKGRPLAAASSTAADASSPGCLSATAQDTEREERGRPLAANVKEDIRHGRRAQCCGRNPHHALPLADEGVFSPGRLVLHLEAERGRLEASIGGHAAQGTCLEKTVASRPIRTT
jgi:hypothetical protein